jgi:hypothetical protein
MTLSEPGHNATPSARGPLDALGSATFRKKAKKAGAEPDECYR